MTALLTSCASTDSRSIDKSAATIGKLQAVRTIPDWPADCRVKEQHVRITKNAQPWSLLVLEGQQLDKQNARIERCAGFYDRMKATQEAATN